MIVIPVTMVIVTAYIVWYHRTQFKRKLHWIHKTATNGVLTRDDLPWIWTMLGFPGLAAQAEAEG